MATTKEYMDFVLEQLPVPVRCRKMFGEYLVYLQDKPVLQVCDNTVYVKKLPELEPLLRDAPCGAPYAGSKEHYILDIENRPLTEQVLQNAWAATPLPRKRKSKQ